MAKNSAKKLKETPRDKIIAAGMHLADTQGWEYTTLRDIAEQAEMSLADLHDHIEDKNDILVLLGKKIDRCVMENISDDLERDTNTARDRLFDILMDRFDALNDYRSGVMAILDSFRYDPKQAVISLPHLCRSMTWMLEAAGIETSGIKGAMKVTGLTGVYLKVLKTWVEDDSPDMAKTMAALDKALERAERAADTFGF